MSELTKNGTKKRNRPQSKYVPKPQYAIIADEHSKINEALGKSRAEMLKKPIITTIDYKGFRINYGDGWREVEHFMKQGYRFVIDPKSHIAILVRSEYTIDCAGERYTFPTRVIMIHGLRGMGMESIEAFFSMYEAKNDYVDGSSGRKVELSYHMQRVPYEGAMAWRMVVNKS